MPTESEIIAIIKKTADEAGISPALFRIGLAVLRAESNLDPNAVCVNKGSRDRGIAQWNSRWWPQITDAMAFDVRIATQWFWKIWPKHPNWWIAFKNGSYKRYL